MKIVFESLAMGEMKDVFLEWKKNDVSHTFISEKKWRFSHWCILIIFDLPTTRVDQKIFFGTTSCLRVFYHMSKFFFEKSMSGVQNHKKQTDKIVILMKSAPSKKSGLLTHHQKNFGLLWFWPPDIAIKKNFVILWLNTLRHDGVQKNAQLW